MRQELARAEGPAVGKGEGSSDAPPGVSLGPELESFLHDLQEKWGDASENAEALVKTHPIAALAGAFLVGIAVGRLIGRP